MASNECYDRIRFSLNDESGVLRFETFEIAGATECRNVEQELRAYLVGRSLAEIDLGYLRGLTCDENGVCLRTVIQLVEEHQKLFLGTRNKK